MAIEADVELGGTDQLFNLLAGRELMEKSGHGAAGLRSRCPLLEGTDGVQKMSKSYGNYVGLTDPPAEMFGKVMSIPDELMIKYYRLCTALSRRRGRRARARRWRTGARIRTSVKRRLAREIVDALPLRQDAGDAAEEAFDRVFKQHQAPEDVPSVAVELADEVYLPGAAARARAWRRRARRGVALIDGGGVRIDGEPVAAGTYNLARARVEGRGRSGGEAPVRAAGGSRLTASWLPRVRYTRVRGVQR